MNGTKQLCVGLRLAGRTGHTPVGVSHVPVSGNILGTLESMIKIGSGFPIILIPPFLVFSIGQPYPLFGSNGGVEILESYI